MQVLLLGDLSVYEVLLDCQIPLKPRSVWLLESPNNPDDPVKKGDFLELGEVKLKLPKFDGSRSWVVVLGEWNEVWFLKLELVDVGLDVLEGSDWELGLGHVS